MLRTKEQYIKTLGAMKRNVFFNGERIDRTDELQQLCIDVMATTYDVAQNPDPDVKDLILAESHLTGETINRFTHIHMTTDDLHRKQDLTRWLGRRVGGCIQRCMGVDAANAIYNVSYEADKQNGGATSYHDNFKAWLGRFQREDLIGCCAQTDVKGDRMKRPHEQVDPDLYLRVKERRSDGIVVSGCKVHISEASIADEILVVPTRALGSRDKDYAVAFAIPGDWEGLKQVVTIHNLRNREHFPRGFMPGYTDSYLIFDDCFVPWERVFLCGEHLCGGALALLFALFHRHSYSGCKPAIGDVLLGTAALAAEINNIEKTGHVREKLAEIISVTELGYAAGYTASALAKPELYVPGLGSVPFGPGSMIPHSIYCNVGRCLTGEAVYREQEILCDIAGGIPATFPHEGDWVNPETKDLLEKYVMRNPDISAANAANFWRFLGDILCSSTGGVATMGNYHGGGSPVMEQIAITTQYNIEERKELVRRLVGWSED